MKSNKQKTDWEKIFINKFCDTSMSGYSCWLNEEIDGYVAIEFIKTLLLTQRQQIISEIEGIVGDTEPTGLTMDLVIDSAESIRVYGRNQLRKEIKERLKQITNLKDK